MIEEGNSGHRLMTVPFRFPPAECSVIGDVFVTTFDGRIFLQPGECQYVLAKSRSSSKFTVTLQYTTCAEVACMMNWIYTTRAHTVTFDAMFWYSITQVDGCVYVSTASGVYSVSDSGVGWRCESPNHFDQRGGHYNWCQPGACPSLCQR